MVEQEVPKIVVEPPGPKAREIIEMDKRYLITSTKTTDIGPVGVRGRGAIVEDIDGNRYIDLSAGIAVVNTGHCHPKVVEAIKKQVEELIHFAGQDYYNKLQVELAKRLTEITPGDFDKKVFLCNSGTESVECAIKLALRRKPGKYRMVSFIGAFHGRTLGSLSLTGSKPVHRRAYLLSAPLSVHVPYGYCYRCAYKMEYPDCDLWCVHFIEDVCFHSYVPPEEVAAIIAEPIQGEGGYIVPPDGFFQELKKICDRYDILLIIDEVQSGFGRTGRWFAIEHWGVEPDIICLAKGIASGMPLGATVARAELDFKEKGAHSNTYGGNLVACAAALATIDVIEEERLCENAQKVGGFMLKRLKEMAESHPIIGDVRGKGLMIGVELVKDRATKEPAKEANEDLVREGLKRGIILLPCGVSTMRIAPPLVISQELAEKGLEIFEEALAAVEKKHGIK